MKTIRGGTVWVAVAVLLVLFQPPADAGIKVYEDGDKYAEFGGRIQVQYRVDDPDGADTTDRVFLRRLRPYLAGSVTKDWKGKIQVDFGATLNDDEVNIKDGYMQYVGWDDLELTIGNTKPPYSREFLTSSKRFQLVELSPAGNHNLGSPDRMLGVRLDGQAADEKVLWMIAGGGENHDPAAAAMDLDSPANSKSDWNEGGLVAGRLEFHPNGKVKYDRSDFHTDGIKVTLQGGFYYWKNDGDNNTYTDAGADTSFSTSKADLDEAYGFEVSGGLRGEGVSVDAEYQRVSGKTVVSTFTGGLYKNGENDMDIVSLQGGYMAVPKRLELVAGWDMLDASNYAKAWTRTLLGFNVFVNKYKVRFQANYAFQKNFLGADGVDNNTGWVQAQYVF